MTEPNNWLRESLSNKCSKRSGLIFALEIVFYITFRKPSIKIFSFGFFFPEAVIRRRSVKNLFLKFRKTIGIFDNSNNIKFVITSAKAFSCFKKDLFYIYFYKKVFKEVFPHPELKTMIS